MRGYRIELGEVVTALRSVPGVVDAAVVSTGDALHAFHTGRSIPSSAMRLALRALLPAYMTPATIVWVESLPTNVNGKTDHGALDRLVAGHRS